MKKHSTEKPIPCFKRWSRKNYGIFASLHRYVKIGVLTVGMSILLLATQEAVAQESDSIPISRSMRIDEIGIKGTRLSPTRSTMSQTPLYDRATEAAAPFQTLEATLRPVPALDIRERGSKGTQADISIRGGSFDQTMLLLNGINFTDARTGHQTHSLPLDMDCISGIELIDGIAGVGAYAGAVNIRTQPLAPLYLRLRAEGGSHGYLYTNLSGAASSDRFSLFGAGSIRRSDGFMKNTDFRKVNGYLRMTYDSRQAGFFDLQIGGQGNRFGSNGFYAAYNPDQFEQTATALTSLRWTRMFGRVELQADASYRKVFDRYEWTRGTPTNYHNTDDIGAGLRVNYNSKAGITSLGGDYSYNHIFSTNLGDPLPEPKGRYSKAKSRQTGNLWLRHVKQWQRFDIAASAGISMTPYGSRALWSVAGGYRPAEGLRIDLGAVQSMRLPTYTDLYYSSAAQLNNLDLKPEHAVTYRIGADFRRSGWHASVRSFYRDGRDIIDWVWRDELTVGGETFYDKWHSEQESHLGTFGAEVSGGWNRPTGFLRSLSLSYGYLTTEKLDHAVTSSIFDYMQHKASISAGVRFLRRFSLCVTGSVFDRYGSYNEYLRNDDGSIRKDEAGKMVTRLRPFDPYFLLDGRLSWQKGIVELHCDATNLTDTDYCDFGGIRLPGCWISAGLTLTIR